MFVNWDDNRPEEPFYMPNAFSPNDDGVNDFFRPYLAEGAAFNFYELHLFDRWGAHLFASFDSDSGWDGFYKNKMMHHGVYVWYLKAEIDVCGEMKSIFKKGDVTLLR